MSKWFKERADQRRANVIAKAYHDGHIGMAIYLTSAGMPRCDKKYQVFVWLSTLFQSGRGDVFFGACAIVSRAVHAQAVPKCQEVGSWADYRANN